LWFLLTGCGGGRLKSCGGFGIGERKREDRERERERERHERERGRLVVKEAAAHLRHSTHDLIVKLFKLVD
jgi:hypothetical protein